MKSIRDIYQNTIRCWFAGWNRLAMLIGALMMLLAGWMTRSVCGSPNQMGIMIQFGDQIPPVWVMTMLWILWYLILGGLFGGVMSDRRGNCYDKVYRYRGAMLFLCMAFLGFLWYPVFFVCARFFVAAMILLFVMACCAGCAWFWGKVSKVAGVIILIHLIFLLWLFIINMKVVFLN